MFSDLEKRLKQPIDKINRKTRQIQAHWKSLAILVLLGTFFSFIIIFLFLKAQNANSILNSVLIPEEQNPAVKAHLLSRVELLTLKKNRTISLVREIASMHTDYLDSTRQFFRLSHLSYLLEAEKKNHEESIKSYKIILDAFDEMKEFMIVSKNAIRTLNKDLTKAVNDIKYRNGLLELVLRNLDDNPELEYHTFHPPFAPYDMEWMTPFPGTYVPIRVQGPGALLRRHEILDAVKIDTVSGVFISETDVLSVVDARISIVDDFNNNLVSYLGEVKSKLASLRNRIEKTSRNNTRLQKTNEHLLGERRKLEEKIKPKRAEIESLQSNNNELLSEHNQLLQDYEDEFGKQIYLLEKIGKARLEMEQSEG